ncbi:AraC family transcriptional regulator [Paenibacillus luteus]|uniref:AraC family transcriptional regulator n=1 Tax=Paenibacillus luteus TaxID=2545753 RepID=UPI0019D5F83C|nr:AraC family transcriptional regulator [Paenibacillus luteus]
MSAKRNTDNELWYTLKGIKQWLIQQLDAIFSDSVLMNFFSGKVRKVILYIHNRYNEELTAETIGRELSLSGDRIRHLFKEEVGRTVTDYIIWYRMEKVKYSSDKKITRYTRLRKR